MLHSFQVRTLLASTSLLLLATGCSESNKKQDPQPKIYSSYSVRYSQAGITTNTDNTRAMPRFTIGACRPDYGRPGFDSSCQAPVIFDQEDLSRTASTDSKTVLIDPKSIVKGQKLYFAVHYYSYYHNRPPAGSFLKADLLGDNEVLSTVTFTAEEAADPQYFNANCDDVRICGGESIKVVEYTVPSA